MDKENVENLILAKKQEINRLSYSLLGTMLEPSGEYLNDREDDAYLMETAELLTSYAEALLQDSGYAPCNPYYDGESEEICALSGTCMVDNCPYRKMVERLEN